MFGSNGLVPTVGAGPGSTAWQTRGRIGRFLVGRSANEVKPGGPGIDVQPRHAQRVVVVPDGGGALAVGVGEFRGSWRPRRNPAVGLLVEEVIPGALGGIAGRDVICGGQEPGFRITVAPVGDAFHAVYVSDDRYRPGVRPRCRRESGTTVAPCLSSRRVGPVQGRVDRQQMGEKVATGVNQLIAPGHGNRHAARGFERERRVVEGGRNSRRAVAPYGRRGQRRRQDLLRKLPYRYVVGVRPRRRHGGRYDQRRKKFRNRARIQRAARYRRGHRHRDAEVVVRHTA